MRVKLKDIGTIITGKTPSTKNKEFWDGNVCFITIEDMNDNLFISNTKRKITDTGLKSLGNNTISGTSILVNCVGNIGAVGITQLTCATNQQINSITNIKDICNPLFLYYKLQTMQKAFEKAAGQTILKILPKTVFENIEIDLPDRKIQDKIAEILLGIDEQINRNNEIVKRLQVLIQAIYSVMFEQYLGKTTVFNTELKRYIPQNWTVKQLKELIELQNGISYNEQDLLSGIPMINLNSFNLDGTYKVDGIKKYGGKYKKDSISQPYDLLISKTDVTRNRDIICKSILTPDFYGEDIVFTSDIAKINCNNISKFYLNAMFNSKTFHNYIKQFANGTVVLHLIVNGLLDFKVPYPNDETFARFDEVVEPMHKQIYGLIKQNLDLTKLKNCLLPLLINGQLPI